MLLLLLLLPALLLLLPPLLPMGSKLLQLALTIVMVMTSVALGGC